MKARPTRDLAALYRVLAVALSTVIVAVGIEVLRNEGKLTSGPTWVVLALVSPFFICTYFFLAQGIVIDIALMIGPMAPYRENSRYYSAIKPKPDPTTDANLPHVTIQLPVYKESLELVIAPTILSVKQAMKTYARQGGTSSILVHDDGMQCLEPKERDERVSFYTKHDVGWIARPKHDDCPDGFKRAGRFKKGSNLNYGIGLSLKLEKHLASLKQAGARDTDEESIEDRALNMAIEETFHMAGQRWRPWAANGKSIRIGSIILLIDADTRVPEDCFRDAAREFAESPEVAIIQHESEVIHVAGHYFENGVTEFTRRTYHYITVAAANGDLPHFFGHNAFLRWSALQAATFVDKQDGLPKIWSEIDTIEDTELSLRLQTIGYILRWVTYSDGSFMEGVALTIEQEINRWQRFSFGWSCLTFNPLSAWNQGLITPRMLPFLRSTVPFHHKVTALYNLLGYYHLAAFTLLPLVGYFILGFTLDIEWYYGLYFWLAVNFGHPVIRNISCSIHKNRMGKGNGISLVLTNIKWTPFYLMFYTSVSVPSMIAMLSYIFSLPMTFGATKKEVEPSNFFIEFPRILKHFWLTNTICLFITATLLFSPTMLMSAVWQIPNRDLGITLPAIVFVVNNILAPIVFNPWLWNFSNDQ